MGVSLLLLVEIIPEIENIFTVFDKIDMV